MELNLRPPSTRFHPLMRPRRGFAGLGASNINATTIWTPQGGYVGGGSTVSPTYQTPNFIPTPACASGPAATADSAACIAAVLAAQNQNMQLNNNANFTADVGTCESNLAANNAQRASLGLPALPDTCTQNTYDLVPVGGYTGDASVSGPQVIVDANGNIVSNPPPVYTGPPLATSPGTSTGGGSPSFSFTNLTSGNNSVFNVGDRWQIQITGARPNAVVMLSGGQNGASSTANMGTTDSSGSFATNGQMSSAEIGSWSEQWTVGGVSVASFSFTVNPAPGTSSTATGGSVTGSMSDLLSATTTIGGSSIPDWALIGGAVVLLFLVMKR